MIIAYAKPVGHAPRSARSWATNLGGRLGLAALALGLACAQASAQSGADDAPKEGSLAGAAPVGAGALAAVAPGAAPAPPENEVGGSLSLAGASRLAQEDHGLMAAQVGQVEAALAPRRPWPGIGATAVGAVGLAGYAGSVSPRGLEGALTFEQRGSTPSGVGSLSESVIHVQVGWSIANAPGSGR